MKFKTNDRFLHVYADGRMVGLASLSDITFRYSEILDAVMVEAQRGVFEICFDARYDTWEVQA